MTVYSINLGIGWASSGVEYAQAYRSQVFKKLGLDARFIFTDLILADNIAHLTANIGFDTDQVIWLYNYFTDVKLTSTTTTLEDILAQQEGQVTKMEEGPGWTRIYYEQDQLFLTAYWAQNQGRVIDKVEIVSQGILIRKDYYSNLRYCSEFFVPLDGLVVCMERAFYNQDGSLAYQIFLENNEEKVYRLPDQIFYSKQEWMAYFMRSLKLQEEDWVLLDRETGIGQTVFQQVKPARLAVVVHAEHYSQSASNQDYILWNNYYDYAFTQARHVDAFILATPRQEELLRQQLGYYYSIQPRLVTIPVGALEQLESIRPEAPAYSLVTASRLASEKHLDWIIEAVVAAKESLPQLTLDIYGKGGQEDQLQQLIADKAASSYIKLKGHVAMDAVYPHYQAYITASTSEGFGLTLMEAVGHGLAMIGLDCPYGNQTFIENNKNGYLLDFEAGEDWAQLSTKLAGAIIKLFTEADLVAFQTHSASLAQAYLEDQVGKKWLQLLEGESNVSNLS